MANNKIAAYVQTVDGRPLMPVRSYGRVRRMLRSGKARVVRTLPFTIRLTYELKEEHTQMVILGEDPGRTNIGLCAVNEKGRVLYSSDIETRNKLIVTLILQRKRHRQASRRGERLVRKRRADRYNTCFATKFYRTGMGLRPREDFSWERYLPHYKKPVAVKDIKNSESRFCNRKRPKGWLTPTVNQLLQTHQNAIRLVMTILPVTDIVLELNRFAFARMENPEISGKEFQEGPMQGFCSVEEAVSEQQGGTCLFCKKAIDHCHHIVPKSRGGSDALPNRVGLCNTHHDLVHKESLWYNRMVEEKAGLEKKYHPLSALNQMIPYLWWWLWDNLRPWLNIHASGGKRTHDIREELGIAKEHYADAWCIAVSILNWEKMEAPDLLDVYHIMQFRRHDRALTHHVAQRKYRMGKDVVAVNRHKAVMAVPKQNKDGSFTMKETKQTVDSLEEFRAKMQKQYNAKEAERIISLLTVEPSRHCPNSMQRILPGAVFRTNDGVEFVLKGQKSNGKDYLEACTGLPVRKEQIRALEKKAKALKKQGDIAGSKAAKAEAAALKVKDVQHSASKCTLVCRNAGLVYVRQRIA